MMVASSTGTGKGPRGKGVRTTKSPLLREPSADVKDALAHETNVMDIALALEHRGAINCDIVCSLLTKCLQDVSSVVLVMPYLFALLLGFLLLFLSVVGFKIDKSCQNYHC
jgi:hypothetical protein